MSVGGNLSIVGSKLDGLDLTGSTIKGELRLFEEKAGQIIGSWPVLVNQYSDPIIWGMERSSCLLPDSTSLHPVSWHLDPDQATAALSLISQHPAPECPLCHVAARRLHSRYERTLADLPWAGWTVRLELGVRKLFCDALVHKWVSAAGCDGYRGSPAAESSHAVQAQRTALSQNPEGEVQS